MQVDESTVWRERKRWVPPDEYPSDREHEKEYIVAEKYFAPAGKPWPIYTIGLYRAYTEDREYSKTHFVVSANFKSAPDAWWQEIKSTSRGLPPSILRELAKMILEHTPEPAVK